MKKSYWVYLQITFSLKMPLKMTIRSIESKKKSFKFNKKFFSVRFISNNQSNSLKALFSNAELIFFKNLSFTIWEGGMFSNSAKFSLHKKSLFSLLEAFLFFLNIFNLVMAILLVIT